jgi:hypothetical protein
MLVHKVQLVLKEIQVHKVSRVQQVQLDQREQLEHKVQQVLREILTIAI